MSEQAFESRFDGRRLEGRVRFGGFASTRAEGERLIDAAEGELVIDLGGLSYSSSLAVSALVAWYRHAFHQGKVVHFSNVPPELRKIIVVSGLQELLLDDE